MRIADILNCDVIDYIVSNFDTNSCCMLKKIKISKETI